MHLPSVKQLVTAHSLPELRQAEEALIDEQPLPFAVGGADEGEQLTHLSGAIWVHERMAQGTDLPTALREFTQRVRNSIA